MENTKHYILRDNLREDFQVHQPYESMRVGMQTFVRLVEKPFKRRIIKNLMSLEGDAIRLYN